MLSIPRVPMLVAVVLGAFADGSFAATSIDFETPPLDGDASTLSPYVASGVTFTPADGVGFCFGSVVGLVRCQNRPVRNQALCTGVNGQAWYDGSRVPIRADFAPELVVTFVEVEFFTLDVNTAHLRLFNSADMEIASVSGVALDAARCADLSGGVALGVAAPERVAYAILSISDTPAPVDCAPEVCNSCSTFAIDNFTFGDGSVPASGTTWGRLKILYR